MPGHKKNPPLLLLCLIAGTLDAVAAILMSLKYPVASVFQYIASGWFGPAAFKGGAMMVIWGIVFHYFIASFYSILFFCLYPAFRRFIGNKFVIAIVIGVLIWAIMEFLVLPFTDIPRRTSPESISSMLIGAGVLCITLGAPIVIFADRYYRRS
ncbi:MAG: hypothetical protein JSU01_03855 [Bacteroidetes bacterium]|nr:hypothetical protein [Bacteroidota bacterium]